MREIKQKGTKASKVSKDKPSSGEKPNKKTKNESKQSNMLVIEVEKALTMQGNLKPLSEFYDKFYEAE